MSLRVRDEKELTWDFGWDEGNVHAYERVLRLIKPTKENIGLIEYMSAFVRAHKEKLEKMQDKA